MSQRGEQRDGFGTKSLELPQGHSRVILIVMELRRQRVLIDHSELRPIVIGDLPISLREELLHIAQMTEYFQHGPFFGGGFPPHDVVGGRAENCRHGLSRFLKF